MQDMVEQQARLNSFVFQSGKVTFTCDDDHNDDDEDEDADDEDADNDDNDGDDDGLLPHQGQACQVHR